MAGKPTEGYMPHEKENYGRLMEDPVIRDALRRIEEAGYGANAPDLLAALIDDLRRGSLADSGGEQSEFIRQATNDHMGFRMPSERTDQFWTDSGSEEWYRMRDRLARYRPDYMNNQIDRARTRAFEEYNPEWDSSRYMDDYDWAPSKGAYYPPEYYYEEGQGRADGRGPEVRDEFIRRYAQDLMRDGRQSTGRRYLVQQGFSDQDIDEIIRIWAETGMTDEYNDMGLNRDQWIERLDREYGDNPIFDNRADGRGRPNNFYEVLKGGRPRRYQDGRGYIEGDPSGFTNERGTDWTVILEGDSPEDASYTVYNPERQLEYVGRTEADVLDLIRNEFGYMGPIYLGFDPSDVPSVPARGSGPNPKTGLYDWSEGGRPRR